MNVHVEHHVVLATVAQTLLVATFAVAPLAIEYHVMERHALILMNVEKILTPVKMVIV